MKKVVCPEGSECRRRLGFVFSRQPKRVCWNGQVWCRVASGTGIAPKNARWNFARKMMPVLSDRRRQQTWKAGNCSRCERAIIGPRPRN